MSRKVCGAVVLLLIVSVMLVGCGWIESVAVADEGSMAPAETVIYSGTLESEESVVAAEYGGRISEVYVSEGAEVSAGDTVIRLNSALVGRQREQAQAAVATAQGVLDAARARLAAGLAGARSEELAAAQSRLRAAEAAVAAAQAQARAAESHQQSAQAQYDGAEGQLASAQAALSGAEAALAGAQAQELKGSRGATPEEVAIAERNLELTRNALWGKQAQRDAVCGHVGATVSQADCDGAQAAVQVAEEQVRIAELQLAQTREGLRSEDVAALQAQVAQAEAQVAGQLGQVTVAEAGIAAARAALALARADVEAAQAGVAAAEAAWAEAQAGLDLLQAGMRSEELLVLKANVAQAQGAWDGAQAAVAVIDEQLARMTCTAPMDGVVLERLVNEGELALPGAPLLVVGALDPLMLTIYVAEPDLGTVALGQQASVTVDAYDKVFRGVVTQIASRAEFSPKNLETREERVNKVFAVEIAVENGAGRLHPGMPADAVWQ